MTDEEVAASTLWETTYPFDFLVVTNQIAKGELYFTYLSKTSEGKYFARLEGKITDDY